MQNKNEITENIQQSKIEENDMPEDNSQKATSNMPIIPMTESPKPLTMKDVDNVEDLYNAYVNGKVVDFPPWIVRTEKGLEIDSQELFIHISDTQNILSVKLGNAKGIVLYLYTKGYYKLWNDSDCKAFIKSFLPRRIRRAKYWEEVFKELRTEYANTDEEKLNANEKFINMHNGILNIETGELLPHDPEYLFTIQIPVDYEKGLTLDDAPVAKKFFNDITGGNKEDIATLLEVIGLVISNVKGSRFKKLLILKGPGNTGKSVFRELLISLVGLENTHTLDIKQLHGTFGLGGIYGKRLIGSGDMKFSRLPEIDKIKELTGSDHVNVELKYQNSFTTQFRGFLLFNCNDLPSFGGDRRKTCVRTFPYIKL